MTTTASINNKLVTDRDQFIAYLEALYDSQDYLQIELYPKPWKGKGPISRHVTRIGTVANILDELERLNGGPDYGNVYIRTNPVSTFLCNRSATEKDITIVVHFHLDLDEYTAEEALAKFKKLGWPEPSVVVRSGGVERGGKGAHCFFKLAQRFEIKGEDDLDRIKNIIGDALRVLGDDPSTRNVSRLMRPPGFWNVKNAANGTTPARVEMVLNKPGNVIDLDDFAQRVAAAKSPPKMPDMPPEVGQFDDGEGGATGDPRKRAARDTGPPAKPEPIAEGCAWFQHCWDDREVLEEPEWYRMLSVMGRCEDGEQLAHRWSKEHPDYTKEETTKKLKHALADAGPCTCEHVRNKIKGGEKYCAECPHWGKITSPIVLGRKGATKFPPAPKNKNQSSKEPKKPRLKVTTMTDITEQEQAYLWRDRIPRGCLTMVGGRQGTTKNMFLYYIISKITTGSPWWGDVETEQREPGTVILLEAEEDPHTQIKPRLVAAGADCARVHLIEGTAEAGAVHLRHVALQRDLDQIDQLIDRFGDVDLVAISPITSYMGDVKSVSNEEVRNLILHPLKALAERHGCALILLKHPNKEFRNHDPLERIAGSAAFTEAMRAAIIIGNDPNEPDDEKNPRRAGFWEKWSLGSRPGPLAWKIHTGDNGAPAIHFLPDEIGFTAREMLGGFVKADDKQSKPERAWEWIEDYLDTGPTTMAEMNKTATLEAQNDNALFSTDAYAKAKREAVTAERLMRVKRPNQPKTEWWVWLKDGSPPDWYSENRCSNVGKTDGSNVSTATVDSTENGDQSKVGTANVVNVRK